MSITSLASPGRCYARYKRRRGGQRGADFYSTKFEDDEAADDAEDDEGKEIDEVAVGTVRRREVARPLRR